MTRLKKRDIKKALKELMFEKAPLSTNKGRIIRCPFRLGTKDRRHSGRKTFCIDDKDYPIMIDTYDDWNNYRDGQRDRRTIVKNIYPQQYIYKWYGNTKLDEGGYWEARETIKKIRRENRIRRAQKEKKKLKRFNKNYILMNN